MNFSTVLWNTKLHLFNAEKSLNLFRRFLYNSVSRLLRDRTSPFFQLCLLALFICFSHFFSFTEGWHIGFLSLCEMQFSRVTYAWLFTLSVINFKGPGLDYVSFALPKTRLAWIPATQQMQLCFLNIFSLKKRENSLCQPCEAGCLPLLLSVIYFCVCDAFKPRMTAQWYWMCQNPAGKEWYNYRFFMFFLRDEAAGTFVL